MFATGLEKTALSPAAAAGLEGALKGGLGWGAVGAGLGAIAPTEDVRGRYHSRLHNALVGGLTAGIPGAVFHGSNAYDDHVLDAQSKAWREESRAREQAWQARTEARSREREQARASAGPGPGFGADNNPFGSRFRQEYEQARARAAGPGSSRGDAGARARAEQRADARGAGGGLADTAPWLHGVQSQAEAKQRFRGEARKNHPDVGGSTEAMKNINTQWAAAQDHPEFRNMKAAFFAGFKEACVAFGVSA